MSDTPSTPVLPAMTPVADSSQISHIGHDAEKNHLFVQFWRKPTEQEGDEAVRTGRAVFPHAQWTPPEDGANTPPVLAKVPGSIYRYDDVTPDHHAAFMAAPSKGKHFGAVIKGKFTHTKVA